MYFHFSQINEFLCYLNVPHLNKLLLQIAPTSPFPVFKHLELFLKSSKHFSQSAG